MSDFNDPYDPRDWNWIVGDDSARAWSSLASSWVTSWPDRRQTRIATAEELADVLRPFGLRGPVATADDVRIECSRRMQLLVGARDAAHLSIIISNGSREAIRLLRIRTERTWTREEAERAATLEAVEAEIERLRAVSNRLEPSPPVDYLDDMHWRR